MNKIEIIGLGGGNLEQLPLGIYRKLMNHAQAIYARTSEHPVISELMAEGVIFTSFDEVYESHDDFESVYEEIVAILIEKAKTERVIYAVPGHPMLAEQTVQLLLRDQAVEVEIIGGQSYLDDLFTSLKIDPIDGFQFLDATSFSRDMITYKQHLIFCQLYDRFIASEVKLTLLEDLPPDYLVTIIEAVGSESEKQMTIRLEELDRVVEVNNLTSLYVPPAPSNLLHHQFSTLRSIIMTLRGPNGCEWDKKQTHESLRPYALEEVYELIDAINQEDDEGIIEELGDVLLQVLLHSQIGEDDGYFSIDDVIRTITNKMIHRHPHVFAPEKEAKSWEALKKEENPDYDAKIFSSIILEQPALIVAEQLQKKAARVGFDWEDVSAVWNKLTEELTEFKEALANQSFTEMENEFGDVLFVLVNMARFYKINSEIALNLTNKKFIRRFTEVENEVLALGKQLTDMSLAELDNFWELAKRKEE